MKEKQLRRIAARYERFTDEQLILLIRNEIGNLQPEVLPILDQIARERNLPAVVQETIRVQQQGLSKEEMINLVKWYRSLPCPYCGTTHTPLNACQIGSNGFLLGCKECIQQNAINYLTSGRLFGLFTAIVNQTQYDQVINEALGETPTITLLEYIHQHVGQLYANMKDEQEA